LWPLGHPDQALKRSQEAVALAQQVNHPFSLATALCFGAILHFYYLRDLQAAQAYAESLVELTSKEGITFYGASAIIIRGRVQVESGQVEEGIEQIIRGLGSYEAIGSRTFGPDVRTALARAYGKAGQVEQGLRVIAEALALTEQTGERCYEAQSYRIKGKLLRMQDDETEAEASFRKAIEVAQRQQAKSWELRAAMSMARLWQKQGKRKEAHKLLADVYNWFTEGFDTPDLKDAKALLEDLSAD
jgi:predicted ATPase